MCCFNYTLSISYSFFLKAVLRSSMRCDLLWDKIMSEMKGLSDVYGNGDTDYAIVSLFRHKFLIMYRV